VRHKNYERVRTILPVFFFFFPPISVPLAHRLQEAFYFWIQETLKI